MNAAALAYLEQVIELDAGGNLGAVVAKRNAFVTGASTLDAASSVDREDARAILIGVAQDLDQIEPQQFVARFDSLDLSPWPDLEAWRSKLECTLALRPAYAKAHRDTKLDPATFETIWALAICPDRDAVQLRDMFEREIESRRLRIVKRTIRWLRRDHAPVWANHRVFVDRIEQLARERRPVSSIQMIAIVICTAIAVYLAIFGPGA